MFSSGAATNPNRVPDPREEILLETNFEDDGVLTRAYNARPNNGNGNNRRRTYRSDLSIDRYTERGGGRGRKNTNYLALNSTRQNKLWYPNHVRKTKFRCKPHSF